MKRIILIGKSGSGKTTLVQKLNHQKMGYKKTQMIEYSKNIIDTPGEYVENRNFIPALIVSSADCDIVALVQDCSDEYTVFPPNFSQIFNKKAIGIITKIDKCNNDINRAIKHLKLAGVNKIFCTSAFIDEGIDQLKEYLGYY